MRFYLLSNGKVDITDDANNLHRFFLEKGFSDMSIRLDKNYRLEELVITERVKCSSPEARDMISYVKADGVKVYLASIYHETQLNTGTKITVRPHPDLQYAETRAILLNPPADYCPKSTSVQRVFPVNLSPDEYQLRIRKLLKFKDYSPRDTWPLWPQDKGSISVGGMDELSDIFERWKMKRLVKGYGCVELEDIGKKLLQQLIG